MDQKFYFEKFDIVGDYMEKYLERYRNMLGLNSTILITGETGTGKELVARWIHLEDKTRSSRPYVKITIPNIGENIFESEVFGYVKGAFTGAISSKKGLIEVADNGTVFFDEVECATPSMQSKLLQLLEDRLYRKVGDTAYQKTNARFIVSTNLNLYEETLKGNFRSDLYYRLAVLELYLPSLKERGHDLIQIANYYIRKFNIETGKNIKEIGEKELKAFLQYPWKGNVRELKNFIEKAVVFAEKDNIDLSMPDKNSTNVTVDEPAAYKEYMFNKEARFMRKAYEKHNGDVEKIAGAIGMSVPFVYKKIKEFKLG